MDILIAHYNNADLSFTLFVILFMVYSVEKLQGG